MPFEKGNKLGKGQLNKGTIKLSPDEWANFGEWVMKGGLERLNQELNTLEGKEFVNGFTSILEYFKPKLARTELTGKDGQDLGVIVLPPLNESKDSMAANTTADSSPQ